MTKNEKKILQKMEAEAWLRLAKKEKSNAIKAQSYEELKELDCSDDLTNSLRTQWNAFYEALVALGIESDVCDDAKAMHDEALYIREDTLRMQRDLPGYPYKKE